MKLTKKLESEILQAYNAYWNNYLKGNVEAMRVLLDEKYTQVGSAETEVFSNKRDAVRFLYDTIDQVAGKLEMRNRETILENQDPFILVHERCDVYVLADGDWIFYSKFRATSIMQQKKNAWKIIHQHSSFPDARTNEGENIAADKIKDENLKLKEAIKRRTIELEYKNRELEIETALEKVRAIAMSMKNREDMLAICKEISYQLSTLGVKNIRNIQTAIFYASRGTYMNYEYYAKHDKTIITETSYTNHKIHKAFANKMLKSKGSFFKTHIKGDKVKEWVAYQKTTNVFIDTYLNKASSLNYYWYSLGPVALGISTYHPLDKEELKLFLRFLKVFELAYRRYQDIEIAEAQAREAQIEAAMERVRSRSMAMHTSDELTEVIKIVYKQLKLLTIKLEHAGFVVDYTPGGDWHFWIADEQEIPSKITQPYFESVWATQFNTAKEKGEEIFTTHLNFEEKNRFYTKLLSYIPDLPKASKEFYLTCPGLAVTTVVMENVALYIENFEGTPYSENENKILIRFGKVFQQAYTRFLDLQKAEAQAREARIEAALERVRSKSMAMHKTDELKEVIAVVFEKLKELNFNMDRRAAIINIYTEGSKEFTEWITDPGQTYPASFKIPDVPFDVLSHVWKAKEKGEDFSSRVIYKEEKNPFFNYLFNNTGYKSLPEEIKKSMLETEYYTYSIALGKNSGISLPDLSGKLLTGNEIDILKRFAKVFDQAYTRFLDLQKAEAQARESQIESALERVRSRTLAMQKSDELAETAAVLFQQLIALGIAPNRLFIILIKENSAYMEAWLTDEDGSRVNKGFEGDYTKNTSLLKMYEGWKEKRANLVIDMQGAELQEYFHYLHDELKVPFKGGLEQKRRLQYIAYFSHGLIGMASPDEQPAETLQLLERFAYVFNLTFTRFTDLKIAEAHAVQAEQDLIAIKEAKQKAEEALNELQATQKQLIQSEKMASLGELTAGIAHEIQNPLNFVNNFSEVSNELLQEMRVAMEKGDIGEAKEIMTDVIQNLEKINHHGKRADNIVKGMLQHSRTQSGQKELTDINALCDEYLRLAYHGLKAKDPQDAQRTPGAEHNSFNAKLETEFDTSIGKIEVMPQDIGRVILNLINNAFYAVHEKYLNLSTAAVSEKKKLTIEHYEPTVSISTKKMGDKILIKVKDNGPGISQKIVDKIFQPFFTTKPTGQGTGLGLSLAYDIVKAHGGTLIAETKEGEGSSFFISLPMN